MTEPFPFSLPSPVPAANPVEMPDSEGSPTPVPAETPDPEPMAVEPLQSVPVADVAAAETPAPWGLEFVDEQIPGEGEDASPLRLTGPDGRTLLAVFDGMGGSGGAVYEDSNQGRHTGAFFASRLAREVFQKHFQSATLGDGTDLRDELARAFTGKIAELERAPSRVKSRLIRRLPTTAAALWLEQSGENVLHWQAGWAGDSRAYLLTPGAGLQQLTLDDLRDGADAMVNLREDAPMSKFIHADGGFELRWHGGEIELPAVALVCTDGCFGYLPSPAHFEGLLLDTLTAARDAADWATRLRERLAGIAGDDTSLALAGFGWNEFEAVREGFSSRCADLTTRFLAPVDELAVEERRVREHAEELKRTLRERQESLWQAYRGDYGRRQPAPSLSESNYLP